ncbi:MAG: Clp protease N-terminal domain-containing protein [Ruminococcus callidus]
MRYTEGFTGKAILAMKEAIHAAEEFGHTYIGSEHLLLGLMEEGGNAAASALAAQQLNTERLRNGIVDLVGRGIPAQVQEDCLTPSLVAILEDAKERARDAGCCLAGTEHLLLAIIHAPCSSAVTILKKLGVSLNQLCTLCSSDTAYGVRMERNRMDTLSRKNCPALFQYGKLMTDPSNPYRYDPLIGREKELQQMIRILSRRTKNNPCLIGEAGVGKTAIVEGIARKILQGDVPESLQQMQLFALDLPALLSGAKYRGDFEERLKNCLAEASSTAMSFCLLMSCTPLWEPVPQKVQLMQQTC